MTKEEILNSLFDFKKEALQNGFADEDVYINDIYKAMDEYAKQEAIKFKEWCDENEAVQQYANGRHLSIEELYNFFNSPTIFNDKK